MRVATPQYEGQFYGVPWILDTKYLFFNTEHLAKAKVDAGELDTWDGVLRRPAPSRRPGSPSTRWCGAGRRPRR